MMHVEFGRMDFDRTNQKGFTINRPNGSGDHLIINFARKATMLLDGRLLDIDDGSVIVFDKDCPQWFTSTDNEMRSNWIHFDLQEAEQVFAQYGLKLNTLFFCESTIVRNFVESIFSQLLQKETYYREYASNLFENLIIYLSRCQAAAGRQSNKAIKDLREQIYLHPEEHWDIDRMCRLLNYSRARFHSVYKSMFRISPMEDVIASRIQKAEYLLKTTDLRINEIGLICGYNNEYHFIRQFKSNRGVSPRNFRKL